MKKNIVSILIVTTTLILAGVAIFTAIRLYQLRNQPLSESKAWDCSKYTFNVSQTGAVTVSNGSTRNEPPQQAKVKINGTEVATLDVPALPTGQSQNIGNVTVPASGQFSWEVIGTKDCSNSGNNTPQDNSEACVALSFSLASTPTPSPSSTPTPSASATPTPSPTVTPTPSPSTTPTPTPTVTPTPGTTSSPTPTPTKTPTPSGSATATPRPTALAKAPTPTPEPQLPPAGVPLPTIFGIVAGLLLISGAILLAL
jgi:hypothetical protein